MNRRQFLLGTTAGVASASLPAVAFPLQTIVDRALPGSERTALYIFESTAGGFKDNYFYEMWMRSKAEDFIREWNT